MEQNLFCNFYLLLLTAEKVQGLGQLWHRGCFRCAKCNGTMSSGQELEVRYTLHWTGLMHTPEYFTTLHYTTDLVFQVKLLTYSYKPNHRITNKEDLTIT